MDNFGKSGGGAVELRLAITFLFFSSFFLSFLSFLSFLFFFFLSFFSFLLEGSSFAGSLPRERERERVRREVRRWLFFSRKEPATGVI